MTHEHDPGDIDARSAGRNWTSLKDPSAVVSLYSAAAPRFGGARRGFRKSVTRWHPPLWPGLEPSSENPISSPWMDQVLSISRPCSYAASIRAKTAANSGDSRSGVYSHEIGQPIAGAHDVFPKATTSIPCLRKSGSVRLAKRACKSAIRLSGTLPQPASLSFHS